MGASVRLQEKIKRSNLFEGQENRNSAGLSISWRQRFLPAEDPLEVELYASRRSHKRYLKRCFLILKSLDSDNLWKRLKESMKALSSCCSLEHIPF